MSTALPRWPKGSEGYGSNPLATVQAKLLDPEQTVRVLALGDSMVERYSASPYTSAWVELLPDLLRAATGRPAVAKTNEFVRTGYTGNSAPWYTLSGGSWANTLGLGTLARIMGNGNTALSAVPAGTTSIDVYFTGSATTGSIEVKLAGVVIATIDTATAAQEHGNFVNIPITPPESTAALLFTSSGTTVLEGFYWYMGNEDEDVVILNGGKGAYTAAGWMAIGDPVGSYIPSLVANTQPDLVLLGIGVNDWFSGASKATIKSRITTLVNSLRTANADLPIVMLEYYEMGTQQSATIPWSSLETAYEELAGELSLKRFSFAPIIGSFQGGTNPYDAGDHIHINNAGHALVADALCKKLVGAL